MSCDCVSVALVQTVKSPCSQSNCNMISVELDSHADTCEVGSNVLVVHDHEGFVDVYGFGKETHHANACTIDAAIAYKDPAMHLTLILMINQAIKINSMHNILICPMQCGVHFTTVNECRKFLSASPAKDDHALLAHDPNVCSPPLTIPFSLDSVTSTLRQDVPALQSMRMRISPSTISHPKFLHETLLLPCTPPRRITCLITGDA